MELIKIRYCFKLGNEDQEVFVLQLNPETLELVENIPEELPDWTRLDFYQCPHCPLDVKKYPHCPVAVNLVNILQKFDTLLSYYQTHLIVTTKERMISQVTTVQRAVSSLVGLVIASSGCPHTIPLKPMARFHLPLANDHETIYRAVSMYLLAQYFLNQDGKEVDLELVGLQRIYNNLQLVNRTMADRLRASAKTDSVLNAIVELDIYAQTVAAVIEDSLAELRYLFEPYFRK